MFKSFLNLSSEKFARVSGSRAREGRLEKVACAPWARQEWVLTSYHLLAQLTTPGSRGDFSRSEHPRQTAGNPRERWEPCHQTEVHPCGEGGAAGFLEGNSGEPACWKGERAELGLSADRKAGVSGAHSGAPSGVCTTGAARACESVSSFPGSRFLLRRGDPLGSSGGLRLSS